MPVLTRFPGGGGDTGYKHYIGNTKNISVKTGASNTVCLNWEDPENFIVDGNTLSEWKGCIVVAKEGTPPRSVNDGIRVAEVTEKNKYKVAQLITEIGGPGYYYGIFPYTKDFVVNENTSNAQLLEATLETSSWGLIEHMSQNGQASTLWSVGDEKKLSIETYGTVTMQIAGFNHDTLSDGTGKAGITFISKELVADVAGTNYYAPRTVMNEASKIKALLPSDVQNVIKQVDKVCTYSTYVDTLASYIFTPSAEEVGQSAKFNGQVIDITRDGTLYPLFTYDSAGNLGRIKTALKTGLAAEWWTRTGYKHQGLDRAMYINTSGIGASISTGSSTKAFCIMFCI